MPLNKGSSPDIISANIRELIKAGHSHKQAIAAALDMAHSKQENRCWKGYEPTPGKEPYSDGSCRKIQSKEEECSSVACNNDGKKVTNITAKAIDRGTEYPSSSANNEQTSIQSLDYTQDHKALKVQGGGGDKTYAGMPNYTTKGHIGTQN